MHDFMTKLELSDGLNDVKLPRVLKFIKGFGLLKLEGGRTYHVDSEDNEVGLVILEGYCDVSIGEKKYERLGSRTSVFAGLPTALYLPRDSRLSISSERALVAVCKSKCQTKTSPAVIHANEIEPRTIGKDNWKREVHIIIGPGSPSVNLIVGETINPPGNWSGIPPQKHEVKNLPKESWHEELYYFRVDKRQGWGIERIYSPEHKVNELVFLDDNTVTFMPWGYHEVVAAPGYTLYYLFFLSGEGHQLAGYDDPDHGWIRNL